MPSSGDEIVAILDTLQDPYFEAVPSGTITLVNRAFCEALAYPSKEDVVGRNFRHFTAREDVRTIFEHFKTLYRTGQPIPPFEFHYLRRGGEIQVAEIVVSPILENGEVTGARGILRDISERIRAERILKQAKEAAEHHAVELAAINRVAATVSRSLNLDEVLQSVCVELTRVFPIRNAGIGLLNAARTGLQVVAFHSADPGETSALGMTLPLEGSAASQEVLAEKRTVVVQDAQLDARMRGMAEITRERGTKAIMIVPLLARGEAIGTIGMPARDPDYVFREKEIELAETLASQIAAAVDNARLHGLTESALDVAERDLEIGRQIQAGFFPEALPEIPGWELGARFDAARQVAGDFYDAFRFKDSNLTALIVADVCDKGVGAALFMVLLRSLLRAFSAGRVDPENVRTLLLEIVLNTNNFIAEYHGRSNMFATLFFGVLDPDQAILHYVNGGHEPPVVTDATGAIRRRLMPTGPAVGLFPDLDFGVEAVEFEPGDLLVGFTDGVTDAKNPAGEMFSEERLLDRLAAPSTSVFSVLFDLAAELKRHIGDRSQFDDITLVALRRKPEGEPERHSIRRPAAMEALADLMGFAEGAARRAGLDDEDVFAFKLVTEEVCANIIQHGFAGAAPGLIVLAFEVDQAAARLTIRDDGMHFAPEQAARPDLEAGWEARPIGGLGLFLVEELMDRLAYTRTEDDFNQFELIKDR
ncbi:MAG TPA: SpoIIE family protein phosphatase [Anaerolineales bacterium]|nr:SpoIIE family protein phosphatase [Anaerolineales bacterium]